MDTVDILIFGGLAVFGTAYVVWLSFTPVGRAFNQSPEFQPFLTIVGLVPFLAAVFAKFGVVPASYITLMLIAIGGPFVVRGLYRLARSITAENAAREKAADYGRQFARRD